MKMMVTATLQFLVDVDEEAEHYPDNDEYVKKRDTIMQSVEDNLRNQEVHVLGLDVISEDDQEDDYA